jgi:hypothetical protein
MNPTALPLSKMSLGYFSSEQVHMNVFFKCQLFYRIPHTVIL